MNERGGTNTANRSGETPVREVLLEKGDWQVYTASPGTSVLEALAIMEEHDIGVLIVTAGEEVAGILSERDCARRVLLEGKDPGRTSVGSVMNGDVCSVTANKEISECLELMLRRRIRHLPVFFGRHLVGCVSLRSLLEYIHRTSSPGMKTAATKSCGAERKERKS